MPPVPSRCLPPRTKASPEPVENRLQAMRRELLDEYQEMQRKKASEREKQLERQALHDRIDSLKEALEGEQREKQKLRGLAASLRARVAAVHRACGDLESQQKMYDDFTATKAAENASRHPSMLASDGMLTFSRMEGEVKRMKGFPRSTKRTAFCTDYRNRRYLGVREADAKDALQKRVDAILTAATEESSAREKERQHGGAASAPAPEYRGLSAAGYLGIDSKIDLAEFRKRSSRRTRMYRDYEGRMIKMDPSDWPSTDGALL